MIPRHWQQLIVREKRPMKHHTKPYGSNTEGHYYGRVDYESGGVHDRTPTGTMTEHGLHVLGKANLL